MGEKKNGVINIFNTNTMVYIITILVYLIWWAFLMCSSNFESKYWALRNKTSNIFNSKNEHTVLTYMRILIGIPLSVILFYYYGWYCLFGIISMILSAPFFHDGAYYYFRNKLDGSYPKGFKDVSHTSTAKLPTLEYSIRLMLLIHTTILIAMMITI